MDYETTIETLKNMRCACARDYLDRSALDFAISHLMAAKDSPEYKSKNKLDKIREVILDYTIPTDKKIYDIRVILEMNG